ncbi:MAG: hypothetical protein JNK87_25040 [Bryobacterales bacterium]|nr:hypothetical protein [Bryobacterales bacterium]
MEGNRQLDTARLAILLCCCSVVAAGADAIEEASAAFRRQDYATAARHALAHVALHPGDPLGHDLLGTIFYLEGNLEAALLHWNRIGKPVLADTGEMLRLEDLRIAQIRNPSQAVALEARDDGTFLLHLAPARQFGFGSGNRWLAIAGMLRGVWHQALLPEYRTRQGTEVTAILRWDPDKRRAAADLIRPFGLQSRYRLRLGADARDERWQLPNTPLFPLRRTAVHAAVSALPGSSWQWSAGGEWSHREVGGLAGYQLKQTIRIDRALWRRPERRFHSAAHVESQTARLWMAGQSSLFAKTSGGLRAVWYPQRRGDNWVLEARASAGTIAGRVPFDELFQLGIERDNHLWLRGHVGTRDGRKGSAPLGRRYGLAQLEYARKVWSNGLMTLSLSPFADLGRMERTPLLIDLGIQAKLRILGVGVTFSYGRDLRNGRNAFYAWSTAGGTR